MIIIIAIIIYNTFLCTDRQNFYYYYLFIWFFLKSFLKGKLLWYRKQSDGQTFVSWLEILWNVLNWWTGLLTFNLKKKVKYENSLDIIISFKLGGDYYEQFYFPWFFFFLI